MRAKPSPATRSYLTDGGRLDDEADVHDFGEGDHRRLVGAGLLDLPPVEESGEPGQGDDRDDGVEQAGAQISGEPGASAPSGVRGR
jgi:hypothetical protein